jgi:tRNA(Ile)-lysidine synthetase-like protein
MPLAKAPAGTQPSKDMSARLYQTEKTSWFTDWWLSSPSLWFHSEELPAEVACDIEDLLSTGDTSILGNIILYDQIPRHVYRGQNANHIIQYFLEKSLSYIDHICLEDLTDTQWTFVMLPYRHCGINIMEVINDAWDRYKLRESPIMKRFIKACYAHMKPSFNFTSYPYFQFPNTTTCKGFDSLPFKNILEFAPTNLSSHTTSHNQLVQYFKQFSSLSKPVVLSLSGGVDSMVCSHCLVQANIRMMALHVNYSNNNEINEKEEKFVRAWCDYLGIDLYVLRTNEINRALCSKYEMRDVYEKYTRCRRLTAYKLITSNPHVVLGHNKDDVFENVMSNIANKNRIENLDGMTETSIDDGITFYRPLLTIPKETLIKYAINNRIPFLNNSTPKWSQRGRIRNIVVPVLDEWNLYFKEGLHSLADDMKNISEFICDVGKRSDWTNLPRTKCVMFWKSVFDEVRPSNKSLTNFIGKLDNIGRFRVMLKKDKMVIGRVHDTFITLSYE